MTKLSAGIFLIFLYTDCFSFPPESYPYQDVFSVSIGGPPGREVYERFKPPPDLDKDNLFVPGDERPPTPHRILETVSFCSGAQLPLDAFDDYVKKEFNPASRFIDGFLTWPLGPPEGVRIAVSDGTDEGDLLAAKWPGATPDAPVKRVYLRDDPDNVTIILEIQADAVNSSPKLTDFLKSTIRISRKAQGWMSVGLTKYGEKDPLLCCGFSGSGGIEYNILVADGNRRAGMNLFIEDNYAYMVFSFNKILIARITGIYDEVTGIPERFPPLETRVKDWPVAKLSDELRQKTLPYRDFVIFEELFARGPLPPSEFESLVLSKYKKTGGDAVWWMRGLVKLVVTTQDIEQYAGSLEKLIDVFANEREGYLLRGMREAIVISRGLETLEIPAPIRSALELKLREARKIIKY